jgi:hypothetical protein
MAGIVRTALATTAAWVDAKLDEPFVETVVDGWAAGYRCPRCHQIPRNLLTDCVDPICAAEAFRAELALERQIEASDD